MEKQTQTYQDQNSLKRKQKYTRQTVIFTLSGIILILLLFLDLFTGPVTIPPGEALSILLTGENVVTEWIGIVMTIRLPRILTAILAGAALSVSGLQMQTIFRNPLAGPYVLGISSGASLGVALVILGGHSLFPAFADSPLSNWTITVASWIGSGLVLMIIMAVSLRLKDIMTILILGILFGSAISAIVNILQYTSHESLLKTYVIWTMGSLSAVTGSGMKILLITVSAGLVLAWLTVKPLNAFLLGETYAKTMGVNIRRTRMIVFISTSILAGSITAFCGPIGFIGIAVPHIARMLFKTSSHHCLVPASMIIGASIMLVSDLITQLPLHEQTLPINSVTALVGIPVIIWIILRNYKMSKLM